MLDVYFKSDKEVIRFCEHLFSDNKKIELYWKTHEEWGNHIQFNEQLLTNETMGSMAKSMVEVFKGQRLSHLIRKIIKESYYYKNNDEIERILEITLCFFKEDDQRLQVTTNTNPNQLLLSLFVTNIRNTKTIHYDSIVSFRLNIFKNVLMDYVGLAIDEFKQEEDHQAFVDMLRKYIGKREATYNEIHILQGKNFSFFKSNGKRFSKMELRKIMHKEPLYIVGLDIDELNLAPLVAISPQKIKIYGDNPSEPKTLTVINVFQERVVFRPYRYFPFQNHLGSH